MDAANALYDIADQIAREHAEDCYKMGLNHGTVSRVIADMERHVLGHEGMEDSPVARWARELREALGGNGRDPAEDVSMSAYDLLPQEDREAVAWVREHGGLERVEAQRRESMPRAAYERKKAGFLDHIAECERALGRRREIISELNHRASDLTRENAELRKRAMPEGMEWPRFESGEPVRPGDRLLDKGGDWFEAASFVFTCDWWSVRGYQTEGFGDLNDETRRKLEGMAYGTCVKRPTPKVLDADGAEIRVGDTVYLLPGDWCDEFPCLGYHGGEELEVFSLHADHVVGGIGCRDTRRPKGTCYPQPSQLTHRAPILAADGKPLREGETVWNVKTGERYVVGAFASGCVNVSDGRGGGLQLLPSQLTHERPESWERLEDDATMPAATYCERMGIEVEEGYSFVEPMARDLVRRAKALAERDR